MMSFSKLYFKFDSFPYHCPFHKHLCPISHVFSRIQLNLMYPLISWSKNTTYETKQNKKIIQNVENMTDEHQQQAFGMRQNQSFKFVQI